MKFKHCLLIFLFIGICFKILAQSDMRTLRGKVLELDRTPLEFVNVYINNTSIGTTTKADGSFVLKIPTSVQKIEVVVSFVGYNTLKKVFTPNELSRGVIFLMEGSITLKEIKVTARRDRDWKRKWRIFKDGLLGESQFTNECKILNSNAIRLQYDKDKNVIATANEPIIIENKGLGYKIMFQMDSFISNGKITFFAGDKFFEHLKPIDERQKNRWNKLRRRAYKNSFRNFLVTLTQRKKEDTGFEIFQQTKVREGLYGKTLVSEELKAGSLNKCNADSICRYDSLSGRYVLYSRKPLLVFMLDQFSPVPFFRDYPYKFSQISLPRDSIEFTANGWITMPKGMLIRDYWGNEGFSNLLPDDYEEEKTTETDASPEALAELYADNERKFWFVNGHVIDPGGLPVADANIFINHTENGVKSNQEGKFTLKVPSSMQQLDLLVSSPAFLMAKESFNAKENSESVQIKLRPDNVLATGEKDKDFQRNWRIFEKVLLGDPDALAGKTQFTENCEILNPEVVHFSHSESSKFIASASKPIIIQNNALGYKITYQLRHFESDGNESQISGDKYFEKLIPSDEVQKAIWEKNRLKIFQESVKYFLISLSRNQLERNGFVVFKMRKILDLYDMSVTVKSQLEDSSLIAGKAADLCRFDALGNRFYLHSNYPLLVFLTHRTEPVRLTFKDYPYKRSQIVLPYSYLEFTADGNITNNQNAEMRDFWKNDGLSGSLPDDFSPDQQSLDRISFDAVEVIRAKPLPATLPASLDIINRFANNGMQLSKTEIEERKSSGFGSLANDFNVKIRDEDINLTIFDLLRRIPGMIIKYDPNTATHSAAFSSSMSFQKALQPAALLLDGQFIDSDRVNTILNSINVREIESLGAMKFSSATIFGARGANGVIVITTKK